MPNQVRFRLPKDLWTERDTKRLALNTLASIKRRTMQGTDADGKPFKEYSEKPIYIDFQGARLKPKGYTRKSEDGKSAYYEGGYRVYQIQARSLQLFKCFKLGTRLEPEQLNILYHSALTA